MRSRAQPVIGPREYSFVPITQLCGLARDKLRPLLFIKLFGLGAHDRKFRWSVHDESPSPFLREQFACPDRGAAQAKTEHNRHCTASGRLQPLISCTRASDCDAMSTGSHASQTLNAAACAAST